MSPTIKFSNTAQADFFNTLKTRVDEYFLINKLDRNANQEMYLKTVIMLLLYFVPYILMLTGRFNTFSEHMILWLVMGVGMCGIGLGIMHDANHGSYSKNPNVNYVLGLLINVLGVSHVNWKIQHNYFHHMFTNIQGHDDSLNAGALLRFSPAQKHYSFHRFQHWYIWALYTLETFVWALATDIVRMNRYRRSEALKMAGKSTAYLFAEMLFWKAMYFLFILIIPIYGIGIPWKWALIGYTTMHLLVGIFLTFVFVTNHIMPECDHPVPQNGVVDNSWAVHQVRTSCNYATDNKLFSWFVGGLNFQIEHHLFTGICHVHYPAIAKIMKKTAKEFNVPYNSYDTFWDAIRAHNLAMKQLGQPSIQAQY
ncbi:MAG: fatty acid desaturase family protein [Bacteriovoracaceae bacterium]